MSAVDIVILIAAVLSVAVLIFGKVRANRKAREDGCAACTHCDGCTSCVYGSEKDKREQEERQ